MRSFKVKKVYIVLISIIILIVVLRLLLPSVILHRINKAMAHMEGYNGHVDDIDLALIRGAYVIKGMELKRDSTSKKPLKHLKINNIDLAIEWKPLLHGHLVGKAVFNDPDVVFTVSPIPADSAIQDTVKFNAMLKRLMPLKLNKFEINNGSLSYTDSTSKPKVDISMKQIHILALNLTNVYDSINLLPSTVSAQAALYKGLLNFNMKFNPLTDEPTFDLNAELKNTNLPLLNDFMKAYGKFTVSQGTFSLYTEMAAKDGKFIGYVKPLIENLKVLGPQDRKDSFLQKLWESVVGAVAAVFKNKKEDQLATKIPIQGTFNRPKTRVIYAVGEVLRNAFIQALLPSIDKEINIKSVDENDKDQLHKMAETDKKKEKGKDAEKPKDKKKSHA
jgi:hypothetical protein